MLCNLYLERFDLTKGLLFDTLSIIVWYKLCHYDHSVLRVRIVFNTNELVDKTRNSNASRFKQNNSGNNAPQARFFIKQSMPQARFLDQVLMGTLSY